MIDIKKNISLAPYTTFRIGGPTKLFVIVNDINELIQAIQWAKGNKEKYYILGGGSNILFKDEGYDGLIIKLDNQQIIINNQTVTAGAGIMLSKLAMNTIDNNLTGLEWIAGIPGTLGGAIRGNAGAHGGCIADVIETVEVLDGEKIRELKKDNLKLTYRSSILKEKDYIILSAQLKLKPGNKSENKKTLRENAKFRIKTQPKGFSAGSIFKNPPNNYAGKLIEDSGLMGTKIGDAQISKKHANFIINTGNATAKDVLSLINLIKKEVYTQFKVKLEEELIII